MRKTATLKVIITNNIKGWKVYGIQDCVSGRDEENCNIEGNHDQ